MGWILVPSGKQIAAFTAGSSPPPPPPTTFFGRATALKRNAFAFPAGAIARVDPNHPASKNLRHSGIMLSGFPVDISGGGSRRPTSFPVGIQTRSNHGLIGPCSVFPPSTVSAFQGKPALLDTTFTYAGITMFTGTLTGSNDAWFINGTSANNGVDFRMTTGSVFQFLYNNTVNNAVSSFVMSANVPYFVVASFTGTSANFLIMELSTGKVRFETVTGLTAYTATGSDGTHSWGASSSSTGVVRYMAAQMFAATFLSITQMRQWARDPWAFWYQDRMSLVAGVR